jgi:alpha-ketoglutarate-dependent taurine dioxygenase
MPYTKSMQYPGIQEIKANLNFYKEKFINDTILVFRNAHLSFEDHEELQRVMGDVFGWYPNTTAGSISRYIEDHEKNTQRTETNKDEVVLSWHVEHPYYDNPIVAGLWNMLTFNIKQGHGNTLFLDTARVYEMLSESDKEFLEKCVVNSYSYGYFDRMFTTKAIKPHWLTKEPLVRFSLDNVREGWHDLHSFDGRKPTKEESERYLKVANWIVDEINNNEDLRIIHEWQEGDVIIPDLHKLAHAVMGGFSPKDRKFTGLWSYEKNTSLYPEVDESRLK